MHRMNALFNMNVLWIRQIAIEHHLQNEIYLLGCVALSFLHRSTLIRSYSRKYASSQYVWGIFVSHLAKKEQLAFSCNAVILSKSENVELLENIGAAN